MFIKEEVDRGLQLREKQVKAVRKILVESGYRASILKDAMAIVEPRIINSSERDVFTVKTDALRLIQAKYEIPIHELKIVNAIERDSLRHTIQVGMSPANRKKARRRMFLGK